MRNYDHDNTVNPSSLLGVWKLTPYLQLASLELTRKVAWNSSEYYQSRVIEPP
jgi:hypothetical protein